MKNQFKYAIRAGLYVRGPVFVVIFVMNTIFVTLGMLDLLPLPALITAVSLGGVAVAVMLCANIGSDVMIIRRMFTSPEAYLFALTPVPKWKTLLASIITMFVMDIVSMAFVIITQVLLSFNMIGFDQMWNIVVYGFNELSFVSSYTIWGIILFIAGYFLVLMVILFCITAKKSFLYKKPASGLLTFLLACLCFYAVNLIQAIFIPFGTVNTFGPFIMITVKSAIAFPLLTLFFLLEAGVLFVFTSKLMERKMNI